MTCVDSMSLVAEVSVCRDEAIRRLHVAPARASSEEVRRAWSLDGLHLEASNMVWVISVHGAFSINCADTSPGSGVLDPDTLMVRARRREHLELLRGAFPALAEFPVIETPRGDYAFRVVAPKAVVAQVMAELVLAVDHKNFKRACAARSAELGPGYGTALHATWSALARLQDA